MKSGWPWSKALIEELKDDELRNEFVADKVRTRIAMMIRSLREDERRNWSQSQLGKEMGKPANVISRLENPDYGKMSLQTLLEVAAAFKLPLLVDIPSWDDWFRKMRTNSTQQFQHQPFDAELFSTPVANSGTETKGVLFFRDYLVSAADSTSTPPSEKEKAVFRAA
jgi:transcriptional regulator with XRE-family HTH domain